MAKGKTFTVPSAIQPYMPYILPFALFALFTMLGPYLHISRAIIYPIKTIIVAITLYCFRKVYQDEIRFRFDLPAILAGIIVFVIWVLPEGLYPQIGHSEFNPYEYAEGYGFYLTIGFRLAGAVLVVPLMEEIFWRSFALRFAIESDFQSIPLGKFSWFSFLFISLLFGFEHHRWLVGIIAGMAYAGILYRSRNLFSPILAHGITNLLLGIYVLMTQQWSFW